MSNYSSRSSSKSAGAVVFGCLLVLAISAAIDLFTAWILWLIYNAVAPNFHWPSASYYVVFLITCGLFIISGFFKSLSSSKN